MKITAKNFRPLQLRASEVGSPEGIMPFGRRRHVSPQLIARPISTTSEQHFRRPKEYLGEAIPKYQYLGAPQNTGGEKRVTVRHRRSDADNGCPPKAADGSQEHIRNTETTTANTETEEPTFRFGG